MEIKFIENESEDVEKQDCEINAAKRLLKRLKESMGDSLYAAEPMMGICRENS